MAFGDTRLMQKIFKMVMDQLMLKFNPTLINNKIRRLETDYRTLRAKVSRIDVKLEECTCQRRKKD